MNDTAANQSTANVDVNQQNLNSLHLVFSGDWRLQQSRPAFADIEPLLLDISITKITFDTVETFRNNQ